jgi:hypothetical protein
VKFSGGPDTEIPMAKEEGAWKLAVIPEKGAAPAPKKGDKSAPAASPSEVLSQFYKHLESANATGAVDMLSAECISKLVSQFREEPEMAQMLGLSEDDLKKDDKSVLMCILSKTLEQMKTMLQSAGRTSMFKVEVSEETISGTTAKVKAKIYQMDQEEAHEQEVPFVKENGQWKIDKMD